MPKPWLPKLWPPAATALALSLPAAAHAQGVTPYDTYRDAYGAPHTSGNLMIAPDDRTVLGSTTGLGDPFLTRIRPARTWEEIDEIRQGFWEFRADRLRRMRQDADEADARIRRNDERRKGYP